MLTSSQNEKAPILPLHTGSVGTDGSKSRRHLFVGLAILGVVAVACVVVSRSQTDSSGSTSSGSDFSALSTTEYARRDADQYSRDRDGYGPTEALPVICVTNSGTCYAFQLEDGYCDVVCYNIDCGFMDVVDCSR
eukprot:TRINITY_DN2732_c1_g2::TRINITY_DN2732_c1_g2_i1::g.27377::m.27377 TRINITY_DN2732_c1_g2::TRINITY_DN2732_c1_g2_i1::g.27377  ORF type:complete len:146 (-),score=10.50,Notch/PF00066.12/0.0013,DUF2613/PF11021.3/0.036,DUF2881/PF11087.3/1e+03,DUF2881/PF11087.3/0.61 TRINITY_DN2732_c1_g2_i1:333-737(-)